METTTQINISQIIIDTINNLSESLFSSIDNNIYDLLDNLAFINTDILNNSTFEKLLGTNSNNGLLIIANSLLLGFTIYYCIKLIYSNYTGSQVERPYQFIFKLIIFGIFINFSYFICEFILNINFLISSSIKYVGKNILNINISFSQLIQDMNSIIYLEESKFNIFSFNGLIKSFTSISLFNLIFSYSLRYIMVKVFILISPFAILTLFNNSTSWFFKTWFKSLLSLLIMQSLISIILLILFSINYKSSDIFSKLMYIGSMYALIKANNYIRDLIGGISTDISSNINMTSNLLKQ